MLKNCSYYTNVNGSTSKTAKIKKGDITQQHIDIRRRGAGKYHLFDFCCFRSVTHNVAVNICITVSYTHLTLPTKRIV